MINEDCLIILNVLSQKKKLGDIDCCRNCIFWYAAVWREGAREKEKFQKKKKLVKPHSEKSQRPPKDRKDESNSSTFQYNTNEDERPNH